MTTENNKIIAEFICSIDNKYKSISAKEFNLLGEQSYTGKNESVKWLVTEYTRYHSDWNWLMEVVEKIKSIVSLMEIPYTNELIAGLITVNKEAVYNACVEFIKWYNENK